MERTDALASWIENLRDVLVAGDQPVGAINATVATCPPAIKPQVRRLAAGLGRQDPDIVFRRFADDLDDPLGDLVAAGLLIAVQRGARTAAVLSSLAEQARRQADRRRLVEAERAPIQREVTLLTLIMGSLIVAVLVFGRAEYLAPYDTAGGQLFLGGVLAIYALLLVRVQRLAHFPAPEPVPDHGRTLRCAAMIRSGVDDESHRLARARECRRVRRRMADRHGLGPASSDRVAGASSTCIAPAGAPPADVGDRRASSAQRWAGRGDWTGRVGCSRCV